MNEKQLVLMWMGIVIIVLMGLWPPHMTHVKDTDMFSGYHFIIRLKHSRVDSMMVDFTRLLTQWIIVASLTTGLIITYKDENGK